MNIVLLHGFCEDRSIWNALIPHVKNNAELLTLDLPGFGSQNEQFLHGNSIEAMADFIKVALEKRNINVCVLIGHSLGGYVTLAFARKYPHLLHGMGLFHSNAFADSQERKAARLKTIDFIKTNGATTYHRALIPSLFQTNASPTLVEETIAAAKSAKAEGIIAALSAMRNRNDSLDVLQNWNKPILFIAGKYDAVITKESIFEQAVLCNTAMLEVLENSAHMGMVEEPQQSALFVNRFIALCKSQTANA